MVEAILERPPQTEELGDEEAVLSEREGSEVPTEGEPVSFAETLSASLAPEKESGGKDKYAALRDKDWIVDYTTVLSNFEGPLDLLLYLINRAEIEIKDIFVSQVTEQFLDYMKGLPYLDVDKVTEYLNIAASIIKIKAQALVPVIADEYPEDWPEEEDEGTKLIHALEEYRLIKEETEKLKQMETVGYFFKEPDKDAGETRTVFNLDNLTRDGLVKAFSALLIKREKALEGGEVREIPKDQFTVAEKITFIREVFETEKEVTFEHLFTRDFSRSEIITTFQAMLELLKYQFLFVRQEQAFGQIYITFNPEAKEKTLGEIDEYN